jgi:hypothetical protein
MKKCITGVIAALLILTTVLPASGKTDTIHYDISPFQFTFMFPPLSTNGIGNVNYVNSFSLNTFVGLSGGVDGVELGGFINVNRYFVRGFQAAGFGNTVGDFLDGVQLAGFYNVTGGDSRFLQAAGFVNATGGDMEGVQGAGFCNVVGGTVDGVQGAGFINVAGNGVTGVQGAGFMNVAGNFNEGVQGAGFGNVAANGRVNVQGAGFMNTADEVDGVQAAGFLNNANQVEGIQAAGFLNRAGNVKGVQVAGFLNICDSIEGVPIAFISIVRYNGYRRFEIAASETQFVSLSYKMGVNKFYTIYSFGKPAGPDSRWMYSLGFGSRVVENDNSSLSIEAIAHREVWILDDRAPRVFHHPRYNMHSQLGLTYGRKFGRTTELFAGPTLNFSTANTSPAEDTYIPWEPIAPSWAFLDRTLNTNGQVNYAVWFGVKGGIRF